MEGERVQVETTCHQRWLSSCVILPCSPHLCKDTVASSSSWSFVTTIACVRSLWPSGVPVMKFGGRESREELGFSFRRHINQWLYQKTQMHWITRIESIFSQNHQVSSFSSVHTFQSLNRKREKCANSRFFFSITSHWKKASSSGASISKQSLDGRQQGLTLHGTLLRCLK